MKRNIWIAAIAAFVLGGAIGCGEKTEEPATPAATETSSTSGAQTETGALTTDPPVEGAQNASIVEFKNDEGQIICPVMKTVLPDKSKAVSYQDYEGVRYYFCCDGCPEDFKADPAKYAMVNHGDHSHMPGEEAH